VLALAGISLILASLSLSNLNLAFQMFIAAACACSINVITTICIFKIFLGDREDFWIQLIHTVFGIGGLIGPLIVL
jgi:hypothetical protein